MAQADKTGVPLYKIRRLPFLGQKQTAGADQAYEHSICDKTLLTAAIDGVSKASHQLRSTIPVLEGILTQSGGVLSLTLTGYDLEMGIADHH